MKKRDGYVIWPAYFDARNPRSKGRRVPRAIAVEKPTLSELEEAAKRAGLQVLAIEREARYPACWFEEPGRILVRAEGKRKSQVVKIIARELAEVRKAKQLQRRKP